MARLGWAAAGLLSFALVAGAAVPAAAASYTWGYGYARQRVAAAGPGGLAAPGGPAGQEPPFVVPLPGRSQSTPVVVGGRWYLWTYWDGGLRGALWTGTLGAGTGASRAVAVALPGQPGPVVAVAAGGAQTLAEPSDAAVSPDGRWVAFGAGDRLYWWPAGDAAAGTWAEIAGPGAVEANSTSPTFVRDARAPGGWDVCDGNWDGGFACFPVGGGGLPVPSATYQVQWSDPADGDGYTAITSSAAYGGARDLYFGVASAHDPRVVALDAATGAYRVLGGGGAIGAPVSAAVALAGPDLYATDAAGAAYRFDAASGRLLAAYRPAAAGVDIASPAVGGGSLYVLGSDRRELLRLDATTLRVLDAAPADPAGLPASAPTVAAVPGAPDEALYATAGGDIRVVVPAGDGAFSRLAALPGAPGGSSYNYTAAVLDGPRVLLWSDGAAAGWAGRAEEAGPPRGAWPPSRGGLQIYALAPRLTALVSPDPATVGGVPGLLTVLAPPGAAVTAAGAPWGPIALSPVAPSGAPCPGPRVPGLGRFAGSGGAEAGCGALSASYATLAAAAARPGGPHPAFAGDPPAAWLAAGAAFVAWQAPLRLPVAAGAFAIDVTAQTGTGGTAAATVWLTTACPPGVAPDAGGGCTVPVATAPNPWAAAGVPAPPPDDRCPPDLVPGRAGWTTEEYQLLCAPLRPWLVDPGVLACAPVPWAAPAEGGCAAGEAPRP
jgi:hypothetical protein